MENCPKCSEEVCSLEELKLEFEKYKKKHNLPDFTDLNRVFDIEEIDIDTEFFLRKIRRLISDRVAGYLRFIEMILNESLDENKLESSPARPACDVITRGARADI